MNPKDRMGATKPNLSVLPFAPLLEVVAGLYEGRRKYGPWNWRGEQISETIYADAAIRHLMQFIAGEDIDPESGVHHISKAIAGLLIVRDAQMHGCSVDDRYVDQNLNVAAVMNQLADVVERHPEQAESNLPPRGAKVDDGFTPDDVGRTVYGPEGEVGEIVDWDAKCPCHLHVKIQWEAGAGYNWYTVGGTIDGEAVDSRHPNTAVRVNPFPAAKPSLEKYSDTPAGGGSYILNEGDVGKRVGLRDGQFGTVREFDSVERIWPIDFVIEGDEIEDSDCCTLTGFASGSLEDKMDVIEDKKQDGDVVRVYHDA